MLSKPPEKILSITNFNPVALLSLFLLLVGLILSAVGTGLNQWSQFDTERRDPEGGIVDGGTSKTQGLLRRCVDYDLTSEIDARGLSPGELPNSRCLAMTDLDCSLARRPLFSALDILEHDEVQNSDDAGSCDEMKTRLEVALAFMILGIIGTFVALVLYFPLWNWRIFIFGAIAAIASVIFLAIGLGVFADIDQDFAGFFSLEGQATEGCLSYGFGIVLAAFIINVIATVVGVVAIFYTTFAAKQLSKHE